MHIATAATVESLVVTFMISISMRLNIEDRQREVKLFLVGHVIRDGWVLCGDKRARR